MGKEHSLQEMALSTWDPFITILPKHNREIKVTSSLINWSTLEDLRIINLRATALKLGAIIDTKDYSRMERGQREYSLGKGQLATSSTKAHSIVTISFMAKVAIQLYRNIKRCERSIWGEFPQRQKARVRAISNQRRKEIRWEIPIRRAIRIGDHIQRW